MCIFTAAINEACLLLCKVMKQGFQIQTVKVTRKIVECFGLIRLLWLRGEQCEKIASLFFNILLLQQ